MPNYKEVRQSEEDEEGMSAKYFICENATTTTLPNANLRVLNINASYLLLFSGGRRDTNGGQETIPSTCPSVKRE